MSACQRATFYAAALCAFATLPSLSGCRAPEKLPPGAAGGAKGLGIPGDRSGTETEELETDTDTGGDSPASDVPSDLGGDVCDPYRTDSGCETDEKCSFYENGCVPFEGKQAQDESCTVDGTSAPIVDSCAATLVCGFANGESARCLQGCRRDEQDTCVQGRQCGDWIDADLGTGAEDVCFESCALITQTCSNVMDGCYPLAAGEDTIAGCLPRTLVAGVEGEPCASQRDCGIGFACIDGLTLTSCPSSMCCTPLCDESNCVGANLKCDPLGILDQVNVGACVAP